MALRGVRIVTTDGEKERTVTEIRLQDGAAKMISGDREKFHEWKQHGLRPHRNDLPLLNDIGAEYDVDFQTPENKTDRLSPVMPEDGKRFLVMLLAQHARGTYTRAEPVED